MTDAQGQHLVGKRVVVSWNINNRIWTVRLGSKLKGTSPCGNVDSIHLRDVEAVYDEGEEKKRRRYLAERRKRRTVHIALTGVVVAVNSGPPRGSAGWELTTYNPYREPEFHLLGSPKKYVFGAAEMYFPDAQGEYVPVPTRRPKLSGPGAPWTKPGWTHARTRGRRAAEEYELVFGYEAD